MSRAAIQRLKSFDEGTMRRLSRGVLGTLLGLLVLSSLAYDRATGLQPGEATVLMQAESLARDLDLTYERHDFDRLLLSRQQPEDLALASGSDGRRVTWDRPWVLALWLAPFMKLMPATGFVLANALLLAAAAWGAGRALEARLGPLGPLWVAALVFATPAFLGVFRADGDAFLFAVVLGAVAAASWRGATGGAPAGRAWAVAGVLLAVAAVWHPLWLILPVAFLILGGDASGAGGAAAAGVRRMHLVLGFVLATLVQVVGQWWIGGGLVFFGTTRFVFTPSTGFPAVDFSTLHWDQTVQRLSALHFPEAPDMTWGLDLALWFWNGIYLVLGQHGGFVAYAAVALLALLARGRWVWLGTALVAGLVILLTHPFDLFGGVGAVGPERLLPLIALAPLAFFGHDAGDHTGKDRTGRTRLWAVAGGLLLVAVPFLAPAWAHPWQPVLDDDGQRAFVGAAARAILPYETSQRPLPGGPWEDVAGVRVRFLGERGWGESRRGRLMLEAGATARLLLASPRPVRTLVLDFPNATSEPRVAGAELGEISIRPSGGVAYQLIPGGGRHHATFWTPERRWFYQLRFGFDEGPADRPDEPLPFLLDVEYEEDSP